MKRAMTNKIVVSRKARWITVANFSMHLRRTNLILFSEFLIFCLESEEFQKLEYVYKQQFWLPARNAFERCEVAIHLKIEMV